MLKIAAGSVSGVSEPKDVVRTELAIQLHLDTTLVSLFRDAEMQRTARSRSGIFSSYKLFIRAIPCNRANSNRSRE